MSMCDPGHIQASRCHGPKKPACTCGCRQAAVGTWRRRGSSSICALVLATNTRYGGIVRNGMSHTAAVHVEETQPALMVMPSPARHNLSAAATGHLSKQHKRQDDTGDQEGSRRVCKV